MKMRLKGITGQGIKRVAKTIKAQMMLGGRGIDTFTASYLEAMLWSSTDESTEDGGNPMDENYTFEDIASEAVEQAADDCEKFEVENAELLDQVSEEFNVDDDLHGHDFWLTRNGHGVGFWDRGYGDLGDKLADAAVAFGEKYPYVGDDGKIYID